jgi:ribosomal protein L20
MCSFKWGVFVFWDLKNGGESRKKKSPEGKRVPNARTGAYPNYQITDTQPSKTSMTAISLHQISFSGPFCQVHKENCKYSKLLHGFKRRERESVSLSKKMLSNLSVLGNSLCNTEKSICFFHQERLHLDKSKNVILKCFFTIGF